MPHSDPASEGDESSRPGQMQSMRCLTRRQAGKQAREPGEAARTVRHCSGCRSGSSAAGQSHPLQQTVLGPGSGTLHHPGTCQSDTGSHA